MEKTETFGETLVSMPLSPPKKFQKDYPGTEPGARR